MTIIPSSKATVEHLRDLNDEVRELHPVLNVLFRKLPGIERVHYNQGADELGADFILFRRDQALRRTSAIGVVVKADTIRQNTAEVERQIKECFVLRKASDTTEVQIREVWVVSSKEITKNAREVLANQYRDQKIEFISGQDLAGLIDEYAPESFVTTSPKLQAFAAALIAQLESEDRSSLIVPGLETFYIEPNIVRRSFSAYGDQATERKVGNVDALLACIRDSPLSIVQASAGGGKSRLSRELCRRVLSLSEFSDGLLLPATVHAKHLSSNPAETLETLCTTIRSKGSSVAKVLVFVDGLDEVDLDDSEKSRLISEAERAAFAQNANLVVFSRPFSETAVFGLRIHHIDLFRIDQLRGTKAIDFLSRVSGQIDVKSKLVRDLHNSPLLQALDGTPIAYMLLGRLIAENQQDLPSNLTELFQKYTELVLGRWEISKGLRSQQEYEVIVEALTWLAGYMLENKLSEVSRHEVSEWIMDYSRTRGIELDAAIVLERTCHRNSVLYLRHDVMTVGFRHRALAEFFYARNLHRRTELELTPEVFAPYWVNSYYFLAGLRRDCPDLLSQLLKMEPDAESMKILRAFNFGNFLLAAYMTPLSTARDAILHISRDLAEIFHAGCDPKSGSLLSAYPTIQILGALTSVFREQYGYRHFKQVLEEALFTVDEQPVSGTNAISMFLLETAYREAGGDLRFDDLIGRYGDSLPLVLKLAIKHESDRMKELSDRVKRMERNLKRSFRANRGSGEFLRRLYKVPVKELEKPLVEV